MCRCTRGCKTNQCGCRRRGDYCDSQCECVGCKNQGGLLDTLGSMANTIAEAFSENRDKIAYVAAGAGLTFAGFKGYEAISKRNRNILEQIKDNVAQEKSRVEIRTFLSKITENSTDLLTTANKIATWMKANLNWIPDSTEDRAYRFSEILKTRGGDCDDWVSFFCTALEARGFYTALLFFPGGIINGQERQGHVIALIRLGINTPQLTEQWKNHLTHLKTENGHSYRWLICDPQLGQVGTVSREYLEMLHAHKEVFFSLR